MEQYIDFATRHWDLFLALAIVLFLIGRTQKGGANNLSPQQAIQKINHDDAVIIDVREAGEVSEGKIRDSVHIPLGSLKEKTSELEKYKDRPLIMVCRSGNRSGHALNILRKAGFENLYNLKGGVMAWTSANLPLARK
ncbi:MAG: rhodanese-like domain-containing protein [Gammaproteobacteria bacterium]|nr:rhodanese-like domain-containing protein [Gammaproteobacteria bacterium]